MITEQPEYNLSTLKEHFIDCGEYTKDVILDELNYYQGEPYFLCLISENDGVVDGFLIGYKSRSSLWISQIWHDPKVTFDGMSVIALARKFAKEHGMTSVTGETDRKQMKAMQRYGFKEEAVIMKVNI